MQNLFLQSTSPNLSALLALQFDLTPVDVKCAGPEMLLPVPPVSRLPRSCLIIVKLST